MTGTARCPSGIGADIDDLVPLLAEYLPHQRWFSAQGPAAGPATSTITDRTADRRRTSTTPTSSRCCSPSGPPTGPHRYQLWIGWSWQLPDRLAHAVIGAVGGRTAYDALHDTDVSALAARGDRREPRLRVGGARAGPARAGRRDRHVRAEGLVIGAEQSNTSIVYGHSAILKVFRRLEPGPNPDAEIHRALHAVGSTHIAQPLGEIVGPVDGEETTLGAAHRVLRQQRRGLGDGDRQRARPDERGRPARRRGRRRLRRRVLPARARRSPPCTPTWPGVRHHVAPHDELARDPRPDAARGRTRRPTWCPSLAEHRDGDPGRVRAGRRTTRPGSTCSASTATCTSVRCCAR